MMMRTVATYGLAAALTVCASGKATAEPLQCSWSAQGQSCQSSAQCADPLLGCVDGQCRPLCTALGGEADPSQCALGETCVKGDGDVAPVYYCQATGLSVDLNLLDMCIAYFQDGINPVLGVGDVCSLQMTLNQLLDQTNDQRFNIFDVDACLRAFFYRPTCSADGQSCDPGQVFCQSDSECGAGLFCSKESHSCQRECGFIVTRQASGTKALERQCYGNLKVCNYGRGQCEQVNLTKFHCDGDGCEPLRCQIDDDCPAGAYCMMGACTATCSRSLDCPDSSWYCTDANRCEPMPQAGSDSDTEFQPDAYVVHFADKTVGLSPVNNVYEVPLVIMSLDTKAQITSDPSVVFGYRLEVTYANKQASKCRRPESEWSEDVRADCIIAPKQEFVTLLNPFGTIYGDGAAYIGLQLHDENYGRLTQGAYQANVKAIYSNGTSDTLRVVVRKDPLSGSYDGRLSIYVNGPERHLGNTRVSLDLHIDESQGETTWYQLLAEENITADLHDTTPGFPISGYLNGNDTMAFNWPSARTRGDNQIPVRGLYSPSLRRMRLIAIIDLSKDHCVADQGECDEPHSPGAWQRLELPNVFSRDVRRMLHFVGSFDGATRMFHGMYRETITGLSPAPITLEGGFQLQQRIPDDAKITLSGPLNTGTACSQAEGCADVVFSHAEVVAEINEEIDTCCFGYEAAKEHFASADNFANYLNLVYDDPEQGRILDDELSFKDRLTTLVEALAGTEEDEKTLTIHEYLRKSEVFCAPQDGDDVATCISEERLRCGQALYRKALASGWVDLAALGRDSEEPSGYTLFCDPADTDSGGSELDDCHLAASQYPSLVALQEHGRFYQQLVHIRNFSAGADLSDAFFVLYRANQDPILAARALSEKDNKLHSAWEQYNQLRAQIFSPAATEVLFEWPMAQFLGIGQPWLQQMHRVLRDRRDLINELVDLKRRMYAQTDEQDFLFVQHLMQEEYLTQVMLIGLQRKWQGQEFLYDGSGPEMFQHADLILAKINETRNPLGFHSRRVFFENNNLQLSNWEKYRAVLQGFAGETGLLGETVGAVGEAVGEMRAALADQTALAERILAAKQQFEQTVDNLCGPPLAPGSNACETRNASDQEELEYVCENEDCSQVVQVFDDAVGGIEDLACRADQGQYSIEFEGEPRPCARGQMGSLLQEKVQLELQRRQIYRKINVLVEQVDAQSQHILATQSSHTDLVDFIKDKRKEMLNIEIGSAVADFVYETTYLSTDSADCLVIVGIASGTSCAGKAVARGLQAVGLATKHAVDTALLNQRMRVQQAKEIRLMSDSTDATLRQQRMGLDNLEADVQNLISEYEVVTQQLFNLSMRLYDTHFLAQEGAKHYGQNKASIVERLLGEDTGGALRRNGKVQEVNQKFLQMLHVAYKMAMAFGHHYNLQDQGEALAAKVFKMVTPHDVAAFIDELEEFERNYCAMAGIDCDAEHNTAYFKMSLREELFPQLTDVVDARTGKLLSKGQQFHNVITSSAFRKKRKLGSQLIEQIEIPFSIWLNDRRGQSGVTKPYMVSPAECNHMLVGQGQGTFAANIVGARLNENVYYELWRGNTDFIRSCGSQQVTPPSGGVPRLEYPIRTFLVGYAPESGQTAGETPPRFITHTGAEAACKNSQVNSLGFVVDENCYNYFARDRSLAAPDWKLVIPLQGSGLGNEWVLGDGLATEDRPIIDDIVLFFRHRKQPVLP